MGRRLLILPHVGTALGHLTRIGDIFEMLEQEWDEIYVSIPKYAEQYAKRFLSNKAKLVVHEVEFTITGPTGIIDIDGFFQLLQANRKIIKDVSPDFILGDPGIHAGILAEEFNLPWGFVAHAPYFSFPEILKHSDHVELASKAWRVIHTSLDQLVYMGSRGVFCSWEELHERAHDKISISPNGLFLRNGIPIPSNSQKPRKGWLVGKPLQCLVTVSSGDSHPVPSFLTEYLALHFDKVGVLGHNRPYPNPRVIHLGTNYDLRTLVSRETTVITHGGSGTLQYLAESKHITIIPGDLDQLCNGLLAHAYGKASISGLQSWQKRLHQDGPFIRSVPWEEYNFQRLGASGLPIAKNAA